MAAIPDQVHDDGAFKSVAVFHGDAADANDGVRILGVDMKDWDRKPLREIGRESRRVRFARNSRKADQIVYDDVNGAADGETFDRCKVESLRPDALARKRGIAVQHNRNDSRLAVRSHARLLR